jgi:hypothetical protein
MATIARIANNQKRISLSIPCGRHDFIPRTIPREISPLADCLAARCLACVAGEPVMRQFSQLRTGRSMG